MTDPNRAAGAALLRNMRWLPGLLALGLVLIVTPLRAQDAGRLILEQPFPYTAKDMTIQNMLLEMAHKTTVPIIPAAGLSGRADLENSTGSLRDALEDLSGRGLALWWFDGAAIHVEPPEAMTSKLLPLQNVPMADLRRELRAVGLDSPEWPLLGAPDAGIARLVAPQGYVQAVEAVISAMAARQQARGQSGLPLIIRGPGRLRDRITPPPAVLSAPVPGGMTDQARKDRP